MSETPASTHSV